LVTARQKKMRPAQILALGFMGIILAGTLLLMLPISSSTGLGIGAVNALFTSTSAVCVTGLTVIEVGRDLSLFGQIVLLALIQIGGLGFMTMATTIFLLLGKRITLRERLVMQEALGEFRLTGLVRLTRNILIMTVCIELCGALLLSTRFVPIYGWAKGLYYGVFHSISAFCNAGFDLVVESESIIAFQNDVVVNFTIMGLIILGGIGFSVIYDIVKKRRFKRFSLHTKVVLCVTVFLILFGAVAFFALEIDNPKTLGDPDMPWYSKGMGALFQSVTVRTAGFNTISQDHLSLSSKILSMLLMFIGASPASTGGGVKTTTFAVVMLLVYNTIAGKPNLNLFKRRLSPGIAQRALSIIVISIAIVLISAMGMSLVEPTSIPSESLMYEVFSAFGTVGLSTGITADLHVVSKFILIITMFFGRVGPLTLTLALALRQSHNKSAAYKYPEDRLMVG
jgi:trk system potassium uptake protein TrkH